MLPASGYEHHVGSRLLDYCNPKSPWQRGLWTLGTMLGLREALEATQAKAAEVLSAGSLEHLCHVISDVAVGDPGLGSLANRKLVYNCLRQQLVPEVSEYHLLNDLHDRLHNSYLENWVAHLAGPPDKRADAELTSRMIASHLLDAGFSRQHLYDWLHEQAYGHSSVSTLPQLVEECATLVNSPRAIYEVVVPMEARPLKLDHLPSEWRDAPDVSAWFAAHGHKRINQHGALCLEISARDPWDAIEQAIEMIDAIQARFTVGTQGKRQVRFFSEAWIAAVPGSFSLVRPRRGVEVGSIQRTGRLFTVTPDSPVDAALELLAPLDAGPPAAAISGGWAAIEALLFRADDKDRGVAAAQRLANLVACSVPRAELTTLAYKHAATSSDSLAIAIDGAAANRDKALLVAEALLANTPLALSDTSDVLAADRLTSLLDKPVAGFLALSKLADQAFRRIYRQRNLILHWGKRDSVALRATLRTASPIVGAGVDRIAHAWFASRTPPLALSARAYHRIHLADQDGAGPLVDMLE